MKKLTTTADTTTVFERSGNAPVLVAA